MGVKEYGSHVNHILSLFLRWVWERAPPLVMERKHREKKQTIK